MIPQDRMIQILQRFEFLEAQMAVGAGDIAQLGREYAELRPVVEEIRGYRAVVDAIAQAEEMLGDPEMRALAEEELEGLREDLPVREAAVQLALLPRDKADARPAIVEVRP